MNRTHFTHHGLTIIVTDEHAAAQHASVDAIFLSIKDAFAVADIGIVPTQIDITIDGEGTYFFDPSSELQEALEGHANGIRIEPGTYTATRRFEEAEDL